MVSLEKLVASPPRSCAGPASPRLQRRAYDHGACRRPSENAGGRRERRSRSAARPVPRYRALADLSRPHPLQRRQLDHDPQLRLQRRDRNLHLHLRLHRSLRLRQGHARARLRGLERPHPQRAWQIYVAHIFLFAIYMAEISYVATSFENPLYAEEMGILDFLQQPDMTIVQALLLKFKPVNMDVLPLYIVLLPCFRRCCGSCCAPRRSRSAPRSLLYVADLAVRLEPARLSERLLVLQSVRLAAVVRVRRLVRARRGETARAARAVAHHSRRGGALSRVRLRHHADLVRSMPRAQRARAQMARGLDVSDRQDQSRRAALCALPGAGGHHGAVRSRTGASCTRSGYGRRSCAASIRSKSSASACSWRLPGTSPWSRSTRGSPCRSGSACWASSSW